jgi:hypothetical protein
MDRTCIRQSHGENDLTETMGRSNDFKVKNKFDAPLLFYITHLEEFQRC